MHIRYLVQTHTGLPTGKQVFAPNQGTHITAWFVDKNNRRSIPAHQSDSHMHNMDVVQVIIKANVCCMCVLMHLRSGPIYLCDLIMLGTAVEFT